MLEENKSIKAKVWDLILVSPMSPFTMHDLRKDAKSVKLKISGNALSATLYVFWKEGCLRRVDPMRQPYSYAITGKKPFFSQKGRATKPQPTQGEVSSEAMAHAFVQRFLEMTRHEMELNTQVNNLQTRCNDLTLENTKLINQLKNGSVSYSSKDLGMG